MGGRKGKDGIYARGGKILKYVILDDYAIHQSATSTVMKGPDVGSNIDVAIKLFSKYDHYKKDLELRDRFQSTNITSSPIIVPILDSFLWCRKEAGSRIAAQCAFDIEMSTTRRYWRDIYKQETKRQIVALQISHCRTSANQEIETIYCNEMPSETKYSDNLHDVLKGLNIGHPAEGWTDPLRCESQELSHIMYFAKWHLNNISLWSLISVCTAYL